MSITLHKAFDTGMEHYSSQSFETGNELSFLTNVISPRATRTPPPPPPP